MNARLNKLWPCRTVGLFSALLIMVLVGTACGDAETNQSPTNDVAPSEEQEQQEEQNEEQAEQKDIEYNMIINEAIASDIATEMDGELPQELLDWVDEHYQTEFSGMKEMDGHTYVLMARGESSSTGYEIELEELYADGQELYVTASYVDPDPGDMQATVITYPVLLVEVEGSYEDVHFDMG